MDEPGLDPGLHAHALRGLERINRVSATVRAIWDPIATVARRRAPAGTSVLDVACGAGDLAVGLARRARRLRLPLSVDACDVSSTALEHARRQAARRGAAVRFFRHDVHAGPLPGDYDIVVCSLFLHHLSREQAAALLRDMRRAAGSLVVVSDLERSRAGLLLAWLGTRVFSRSPVVHVDGPRSVRAAFTPSEIAAIGSAAGLAPFAVVRHWPRRWRLVAERTT